MTYGASDYALPAAPPPDLLTELDLAARALDLMAQRGVSVSLGMDGDTRSLRIDLHDGSGSTSLSPTQLFELLVPS